MKYNYSKKTILNNINISANKGDIIAVTGENGQGKTTLMKILCGLLKEKEGLVKYKDKPFKYKSRRKLCYMVMQDVINQLFSESIIEEFELSDSKIKKEEVEEILRTRAIVALGKKNVFDPHCSCYDCESVVKFIYKIY